MKLFFYNQRNYKNLAYNRPDGSRATISSSGCGVVSACIAINTLAQKELFTVAKMRDLAKSSGARIMNGTNEVTLLNAIHKKYPKFTYKTSRDVNALVEHLKKGGVAICNQGDKYSIFSTRGHYVCAWCMDGNNINVADPAMKEGKYSTISRKNRVVKETKYGCIVKPSEMAKATQDRYPSYYLISYKKPTPKPTPAPAPKKAYSGNFPSLLLGRALKLGSKGEQVKRLQKFLNWYGENIKVDGIYGEKTKKAVMDFQRKEKLTVDGKFGKRSLAKAKSIKK